MIDLINHKYKASTIAKKRGKIFSLIKKESKNIQSGTITAISTSDLKLMFDLYDQIFFHKWIKENYKGKLKFSLSACDKEAGSTSVKTAELTPEIYWKSKV